MLKLRVLTSVSVVALATAAGVTGAKADNLIIDLTALPPTIEVAAGSSAAAIANEQVNENGGVPAIAQNIAIGFPIATGTSHDLGGGTDTILVDEENAVFALAIGNQEVASINFFVAENGGVAGDDAAATNGSLQYILNNDVTALVDNADIHADVIDLGDGSAVTVSDNSMRADGIGNDAAVSVVGNVNQLQVSTEFGQADITTGSPTLSAGATALSGSVQANLGAQDMSALVSDSRIGLLARVDDDATAIVGVPLDIVGNVIAASFTGNNAATLVDLGADEAVSLVGTAGAANVQTNVGDFDLTAEVRDVTIEAGDTVNYGGTEYIADLDGSTLTLTDSEISATATSNNATNTVKLADNLSQDGEAGLGDQLNVVDFGAIDSSSVNGDLFIANGQYSAVPVSATVDLLNRDSSINVLTEDVTGSTILADDNLITAAAMGSAVVNTIEVGNATEFNSLVGINSVQYTEGTQTATNESLITVDVASTAPASAGVVTNSSLTVDGNEESAEAIGNSHSSAIDIKGTTVTGPSDDSTNLIDSERASTSGSIDADWSILSAQVLDGGSADALLTTGIDVDVADIEFTTASLSVSENDIHGMAIGNLSTEASISIDAVTIDGSIGVVNSQTVEDDALLSSVIIASGGVFIDVDVAAGNGLDPITVSNAAISANDNSFTSRVWGNLADSTTNSINVTGVTVGDADIPFNDVFVDRDSDPVTDVEINGGFALLNDQSVEDLNTATVTATASGDLINITVGDDTDLASSVTNSDISADSNEATTSAVLNQATSSVTIDAVTTSAGASLANVQTLTDEDGIAGSAEMLVDQTDLDIVIDVIAGDEALSELDITANGNSMLASARVNLATNSFKVDAQTQIVDDVFHSGVNQVSVDLDTTPFTRGANLLVNDQAFLNLGVDGVVVNITDNDITIDLSVVDDDIENTVAEVNGNSVNALAAGNDAANTMELNVGTFDLSNTDEQGNQAANGPIANLVSNQWGLGGEDAGFTTNITDTTIAIDALPVTGSTTDIEDSQLSASGNTIRALSRANNVTNTLSASGTKLVNDAPSIPSASVSAIGLVLYDVTSISLACRLV
ncbi:MAG: beta strand repeat-containing protein, partial [Sphingomonadales bacterium]